MGHLSRNRGRAFELRIAKYLSTDSNFTVRRNHFEKSDLTGHPLFTFECKYSSSPLSTKLEKFWKQAIEATEDNKSPALIIGKAHQQSSECMVILSLGDLKKIIEDYEDELNLCLEALD